MPAVTREHKLALIIGFSVFLFVLVLVSDALSKAREEPLANAEVTEPGPIERLSRMFEELRTTPPLVEERDLGAGVGEEREVLVPEGMGEAARSQAAGVNQAGPAGGEAGGLLDDRQAQRRRSNAGPTDILPPGVMIAGSAFDDAEPVPPEFAGLFNPVGSRGEERDQPLKIHQAIRDRDEAREIIRPSESDTRFALYIVKPKQTLSQISAEVLGSAGRWRELQRLNPGLIDDEGNVRAGVEIRVPVAVGDAAPRRAGAAAAAATPERERVKEPIPEIRTRSYVVKKGDTLSEIAMRELGTVRRADEIRRLNPGRIGDKGEVFLGTTLKLPAR